MAQPLININKRTAYYFAFFLVFYQFTIYVADDMIMPAMVSIIDYFNAPESAIELSVTAFLMGGASLQLFLGPLSDRLGRRPVMLFGCLLFLVATLILPFSKTITEFLSARFFEGMGVCFIGGVGYAALNEIFDEKDAIRISSVLISVASLSPLFGPLFGAVMIQFFEWKKIFIVIGILGFSAMVGLWKFMPETVGVVQKNGIRIAPSSVHPYAVLRNYWTLIKNKPFVMGCLALGIMGAPLSVWIAISPIILIVAQHLSITAYALWQLPIIGSTILGNVVLRRLTHTKNLNQLIIYGTLPMIAAPIIAIMLFTFLDESYYWVVIMMVIYGFGLGISGAPLYRQILSLSEYNKGTASALMSLISMLISAGSIQLMTVIYAKHSNVNLIVSTLFNSFLYLLIYYLISSSLKSRFRGQSKIVNWLSLRNIKFKKLRKKTKSNF